MTLSHDLPDTYIPTPFEPTINLRRVTREVWGVEFDEVCRPVTRGEEPEPSRSDALVPPAELALRPRA
ncbi:hypothetical protein [Phenylobacterium sp.]|uniref:hypothetical protein n=1 Tax=Phenylobacterium sp. TaxID=1871053 RepID=UPI0025FFAEC6|nr:hypothetical protein [Phenylobacterium sp.]